MSAPPGAPHEVVIDTNVLVSGVISSRGVPARLLDAIVTGEVTPVVSPRLIDEYRRVSARPKLKRHVGDDVDAVVDALIAASRFQPDPPEETWEVQSRDPDDDFLIALARAAHVRYVVSGDDDLLVLEIPDLETVSPSAYVRHVLGQGGQHPCGSAFVSADLTDLEDSLAPGPRCRHARRLRVSGGDRRR